MAGVSQFTSVQLDGFHSSFLIVFFYFPYTEDYPYIWWYVPQFAPRIVRMLQMSILSRYFVHDEVYHMPVLRAGMCPGGLVCILLFEHGVGHSQIVLSA